MNLGSDKWQNIQMELDFYSEPAGEAREAGREETKSLQAVNVPESPASTNRLMEEVCVCYPWSMGVSVTARIAVYGPVCTVVWQGSAGDRCPYVDQHQHATDGAARRR